MQNVDVPRCLGHGVNPPALTIYFVEVLNIVREVRHDVTDRLQFPFRVVIRFFVLFLVKHIGYALLIAIGKQRVVLCVPRPQVSHNFARSRDIEVAPELDFSELFNRAPENFGIVLRCILERAKFEVAHFLRLIHNAVDEPVVGVRLTQPLFELGDLFRIFLDELCVLRLSTFLLVSVQNVAGNLLPQVFDSSSVAVCRKHDLFGCIVDRRPCVLVHIDHLQETVSLVDRVKEDSLLRQKLRERIGSNASLFRAPHEVNTVFLTKPVLYLVLNVPQVDFVHIPTQNRQLAHCLGDFPVALRIHIRKDGMLNHVIGDTQRNAAAIALLYRVKLLEQVVNDLLPILSSQLAVHSDVLEHEPLLNDRIDDLRRLCFGIYAHTRIVCGKARSLPDGIIAARLRITVLGTVKSETQPAFARELG